MSSPNAFRDSRIARERRLDRLYRPIERRRKLRLDRAQGKAFRLPPVDDRVLPLSPAEVEGQRLLEFAVGNRELTDEELKFVRAYEHAKNGASAMTPAGRPKSDSLEDELAWRREAAGDRKPRSKRARRNLYAPKPGRGNRDQSSLVRIRPLETRSADGAAMPTLFGHFAVWDTWTEINSVIEGRFLERIKKGAMRKTINERRDKIRLLLEHGYDPVAGNKIIGDIEVLKEDETGAYYEAELFDTSFNRDILPGLERGLYGASFRFSVLNEEFDRDPGESEFNPEGIPERTIKEVKLYEVGPCTFGAYPEATAKVRSQGRGSIGLTVSGTDEWLRREQEVHSNWKSAHKRPAAA